MSKYGGKLLLIFLVFTFCSFLIVNNIKGITVEEVVSKYYEAKKELKTYKLIKEEYLKETITPKAEFKPTEWEPTMFETKFEYEVTVDIANKKMFWAEKVMQAAPEFPEISDIEGLTEKFETYVIDNFAYSEHRFYVEGELKEKKWYKLKPLANRLWKESDIFYICNGFKDVERCGLKLKEVSEEKVDGKDCYYISYEIADLDKFKEFVGPAGSEEGIIFTQEFTGIEKEKWDVESFLLKAYISKNTYYPIRSELVLNLTLINEKLEGPFKVMKFDVQYNYKVSDYNKPVDIQLPKEAQEAKEAK